MSLAAETRRAVADYPFLRSALRAEVVNYTAAARFLELDGDDDAVSTALRRYAEELPAYEETSRSVQVTMRSGVKSVERPSEAILVVGETMIGATGGDLTAILATGSVDGRALATALETVTAEGIDIKAAALGDASIVVVVERLDGANAVRAVERSVDGIPE